jgi:hypothetical protein
MPSKLFAALICLTILSSAACRSTDGGGPTPASQQQAASQTPASAVAPAPTPAPNAATGGPSTPGTPAAAAAAADSNPDADACKLLTSEEIQAVQGEGVKATKGTDASSGPLAVSQCFYETTSFTNSVSLTLTSKNGGAKGDGVREFWKKHFSGERGREKNGREKEERERAGGESGEEEESLPPTHVGGIGDDAYWVGNSKALAERALKRI